jgi:orotidine-5'-phosphate decarboxylase
MDTQRRGGVAVALDLDPAPARELGRRLAPEVAWLKVGLSLFCSEGPAIVRELKAAGARIFLDLKLHDIPNTVELAARAVGRLGVSLLTVHASGGEAMVRAAVAGCAQGAAEAGIEAPAVLGVTVLTSLDERELEAIGLSGGPVQSVERLARLAIRAGAGGIVCSPREVGAVRQAVGDGPLLVTPGIRAAGASADDQARAETPEAAVAAGADVLVVGRPVLRAADPVAAGARACRALRGRARAPASGVSVQPGMSGPGKPFLLLFCCRREG